MPDVDAEEWLRPRQTIGCGQTLKGTTERRSRSDGGKQGILEISKVAAGADCPSSGIFSMLQPQPKFAAKQSQKKKKL